MSAIGSICVNYQEDFLTPGNWPALANSLKCILHKPKLLMYPPFLPHIKHLRTIRVEYLGFLFDLAIVDFFGIILNVILHSPCWAQYFVTFVSQLFFNRES